MFCLFVCFIVLLFWDVFFGVCFLGGGGGGWGCLCFMFCFCVVFLVCLGVFFLFRWGVGWESLKPGNRVII